MENKKTFGQNHPFNEPYLHRLALGVEDPEHDVGWNLGVGATQGGQLGPVHVGLLDARCASPQCPQGPHGHRPS